MNTVPTTMRPVNPFLRSAKLAAVVYAVLALAGIGRGQPFHRIPEADRAILSRVAAEYRLSGEPKRLLFAIYLAERGGPGREMGVMVPAAQRFKGHHAKSLECQARWAAGTIRKRYAGDLRAFAVRWCPPSVHPLNRYWLANVRRIMAEQER